MTTNVLEFLITAKEEMSQALEKLDGKLEHTRGVMSGLKVAGAIAMTGIAVAAGEMVKKSVDAFEEVETSHAKLQDVYKRFPALHDVEIGKLYEQSESLGRLTGASNTQITAAQAQLAMYNLTGDQVQKLTPLIVDYAAKTGKSIPDAAAAAGKAILGHGRALADIGIKFKDTHTQAGNLQEVMQGLSDKVGGVAQRMGDTGPGKVARLKEEFGQLEEKIGSHLVPIFEKISDVALKVFDFFDKHKDVLRAVAVAVGILTFAIIGANIAMWALAANPIVLLITAIVIAVGLLIVGIVLLATHWKEVTKFLTDVWTTFVNWIKDVINNFVSWWNQIWAAVGKFISDVWTNWIVNPIKSAWQWVQDFIAFGLRTISDGWNRIWNGLGDVVKGLWNNVIGWVQGGVNGAIDLINGLTSGIRAGLGAVGINIGVIPHVSLPHLATGGYIQQGGIAVVGERGPEVVSLPTGSRVHPNGTGPGGGLHIENFYAMPEQSPAEIAQELGWMGRWAI